MINLRINAHSVAVPEGTTVLRAAEKAGITIPTLCDHPALEPIGGCRLCLVEVKGARTSQASCALPVAEGMEITTESEKLTRERREILEMLYASYFDSGYENGQSHETQFMRWIHHYGIEKAPYSTNAPRHKVDSDPHPMIWVDMNKCILCLRCARACADVQGRHVWEVDGRGSQSLMAPGANGLTLLNARCESCGQCVAFCPTGALDNRMSMGSGEPDKLVTTTCAYCGVGCQFDLNVKDGKVSRVTSNPHAPVNGMALCVKGRYAYDYIHHPDRVLKPRVRKYLLEEKSKKECREQRVESSGAVTNPLVSNPPVPNLWDWVDVEWDVALDIVAQKLGNNRDEFGADSIGLLTSAKCLNEENYLMNKLARQVIGTNNIDHCARL